MSVAPLNLPHLGMGLGLRHQHFDYVLSNKPDVDWFEVISENFMADYGWSRHVLLQIRQHYPVVMHGVSMSIGSTDPLNMEYLASLKALAEELEPAWISDHLCWTGVQYQNSHDLLPMPLSKASLDHVCSRISQVQDYLGRVLVLENPSTYLNFSESEFGEWEFLNRMSERTGCGLLVDVNNVYVSARNHGFDAVEYVDSIRHEAVVQTHISGHTDLGSHCIDTHDQPVCDAVWQLYARLQRLTGGVTTLLEWDANVPSFPELQAELIKAETVIEQQAAGDLRGGTVPSSEYQNPLRDQPLSNPIDIMPIDSGTVSSI